MLERLRLLRGLLLLLRLRRLRATWQPAVITWTDGPFRGSEIQALSRDRGAEAVSNAHEVVVPVNTPRDEAPQRLGNRVL